MASEAMHAAHSSVWLKWRSNTTTRRLEIKSLYSAASKSRASGEFLPARSILVLGSQRGPSSLAAASKSWTPLRRSIRPMSEIYFAVGSRPSMSLAWDLVIDGAGSMGSGLASGRCLGAERCAGASPQGHGAGGFELTEQGAHRGKKATGPVDPYAAPLGGIREQI